MKTLQELYSEIIASDERKKAFVEAMKEGKLGDFLQAHDCEATEEDVVEFIETKAAEDTPIELGVDELNLVAGGTVATNTCGCGGNTHECSDTCIRDCC